MGSHIQVGGHSAHPMGSHILVGGHSAHPTGSYTTRVVYASPPPPQRVYVVGGYPLGSNPSIAYMGGYR
jgi:hypothetical protein